MATTTIRTNTSFGAGCPVLCHPASSATSKHRLNFSSSKKSNLLSGRFLEIRRDSGTGVPLQKERQLGVGSYGTPRTTFLKMSKLDSQNVGVDMPWGNEGMTGDDEGGYLGECWCQVLVEYGGCSQDELRLRGSPSKLHLSHTLWLSRMDL